MNICYRNMTQTGMGWMMTTASTFGMTPLGGR